jgi:hypothetical protein
VDGSMACTSAENTVAGTMCNSGVVILPDPFAANARSVDPWKS